MYVIQRTSDGAFVSKPGSPSSYVKALQLARVYPTREAANNQRCPDNERVVSVEEVMRTCQ